MCLLFAKSTTFDTTLFFFYTQSNNVIENMKMLQVVIRRFTIHIDY